jgi:hypothetical protein
MKTRLMLILTALMLGAAACADEISDTLARAQDLYNKKKYTEAKAEIEKALAALAPMARAQYPAPEVKGNTYVNYEVSFRVTKPAKDWDLAVLKPSGAAAGATMPLCQIACVKETIMGDDVVILYARDLKVFLGARYDATVKGDELAFLKSAGRQMASSVRPLTDVKITGQTEMAIGGNVAVRTDYTARKGDKAMKCFTVDVLRGPIMFTAVFVGNQANDAVIAPAFKEILDSIDLSPVPSPAAGGK